VGQRDTEGIARVCCSLVQGEGLLGLIAGRAQIRAYGEDVFLVLVLGTEARVLVLLDRTGGMSGVWAFPDVEVLARWMTSLPNAISSADWSGWESNRSRSRVVHATCRVCYPG
jgi:hypothetical protein